MKITLIGSGNLATNIGVALKNAGHQIVQVYSRRLLNAVSLASRLEAKAVNQFSEINDDADVYILSLKDSVLQEVIAAVCKNKSDKIFLHTAGSVPMALFEGSAVRYGVLYPMQTFSKERVVDFRSLPCFIEACDNSVLEKIKTLALSISTKVYTLSSADRKYLHLAAVFACNFVNHCYEISSELLAAHSIPFDVLLPLIDETAHKVHELSPAHAQTGPAVRYDENVMEKHKMLLAASPLWQNIYELMSKSIHQTAIINNNKRI